MYLLTVYRYSYKIKSQITEGVDQPTVYSIHR